MKKKVIITLSKTFPKTHKRAGELTHFRSSIEKGVKIHTIRTGYERWRHNIDKVQAGTHIVSLRQWKGVPYRSEQDEIKNIANAGYERISMLYDRSSGKIKATINGKPYDNVKQIAANDGLKWDDFVDFFFGKGAYDKTLFQGIIIHLTDFRYNAK